MPKVLYECLDGGTSWFELNDAAPVVPDVDNNFNLFRAFDARTHETIWVERSWGHLMDGQLEYQQLTYNKAAIWLASNRVEPPDVFLEDLVQHSKLGDSSNPTNPLDPQSPNAPEVPCGLVTLDQAAAMVSVSKRTLERRKTSGDLPVPVIEGGGGRADRWDWKTIRPWLEETFKVSLPEIFPAHRRR